MIINGNNVLLEEIQPKFFNKIIEWRNNPYFNRYLNQPYKLTLELQQKWYKSYLEDTTQGLFVLIDKKNSIPFGTMGWTDFNKNEKTCIAGRLLIGELKYRGSKELIEGALAFYDYIHFGLGVDKLYAHIANSNKESISWNKKWGFKENMSKVKYPDELFVNGLVQTEYVRDCNDYNRVRSIIIKLFNL